MKQMTPSPDASAPLRWYYRPVWVLLLLFVVLGPLGLPYLWNSPRFSRGMKVALTVLVVAYTALLADETIRTVRAVKKELDLLASVGGL